MNPGLAHSALVDAAGIAHAPVDAAPRIVSLVPSLKERRAIAGWRHMSGLRRSLSAAGTV